MASWLADYDGKNSKYATNFEIIKKWKNMTQPFTVWYPTIFPEKCDGCISFEKPRCVQFCPNGVFEIRDGKAVVVQPHKCISGCAACKPVCHRKAISFPKSNASYSQVTQDDKGLLRKVTCEVCGKQYWTNRDRDICFDCESHKLDHPI